MYYWLYLPKDILVDIFPKDVLVAIFTIGVLENIAQPLTKIPAKLAQNLLAVMVFRKLTRAARVVELVFLSGFSTAF